MVIRAKTEWMQIGDVECGFFFQWFLSLKKEARSSRAKIVGKIVRFVEHRKEKVSLS